jgi:vacuolar-type H+-ATPase subunit B/Vma2
VKSKRDSNAIPPEMRCGNKNLSNPDEIANAFADHFAKTFINNNSSRAYNQDGLNFSLNANILRGRIRQW